MVLLNNKPLLVPATLNDYPIIQNIARFYVYDLSRECGFISADWALPGNGLYESFDFKDYFENSARKAYLIMIEAEIAGFVLINQEGLLPKTQWNMGEFFILGKFQGKGIGKSVMGNIFSLHSGIWEISVIPENQSGLQFWRKIISYYTNNNFSENVMEVDYDSDQPKRIIFSFTYS